MDRIDYEDEAFIRDAAGRFATRYAVCCHLVKLQPQPITTSRDIFGKIFIIQQMFASTVPLCEGFFNGVVDRDRLWRVNEIYQREQALIETQTETVAGHLGLRVEDPAQAERLRLTLTGPAYLHSIIHAYTDENGIVKLDNPDRTMFRDKSRAAQASLRPKDGKLAVDTLVVA